MLNPLGLNDELSKPLSYRGARGRLSLLGTLENDEKKSVHRNKG